MKLFISLALCFCLLFSIATVTAENPEIPAPDETNNIYLTLVNKANKLPDDWTSRIELVEAKDYEGNPVYVEKVTLDHYYALRDRILETEGIQIELDSTYRSVEEQQEIWDYWTEAYGLEYCEKYLSPVGFSEHHTGLAIDICLNKNGQIIRDNDEMIADTEDFEKIHKHLAEFGFILRYIPGKEDITGYAYEPWHFRFVGENVAREIMENQLTLEEYLGHKQ